MDIRQYITNIFNVNSYFIKENGHLLIIDPVLTDEIRKEIEQHPVDFALLTHEHYDHICSVNEINDNRLFPVYCGQAASETLKNPRRNLSHYAEFLHECIPFVDKEEKVPIADYSCECDNFLHDGQTLSWQGHELLIKETPGHSKGSICILLDGQYLFSGDTLFKSYETAVRMPGGSSKDYRDITLKWLDSLPSDTMVYPGHLEPFYLKDRHPFGLQKRVIYIMSKTWTQTLDDLGERRASILSAGGEERIRKQHDSGKLTARERIEALFDEGSFNELNDMRLAHATDFGMERKRKAGDGVITGYGLIHGRVAFVASQDFTVSGGSLGEVHAQKICAAMDKAMQVKAPFVFINDSGGARIEEGISSLAGYADIFYRNTLASGMIPQIAVILGPCAGGACYSPAICDYIFMAKRNSQMYITGPQVVKSVIGEEITAAELGGSRIHNTVSGVSHFEYDDDLSCLNGVRRLLGYLPQNSSEKPMVVPGKPVDRGVDIPSIVPDDSRKAYDVHDVIGSFVDDGSFMEVQSGYAQNIVVGFARMDGRSVGIVANQSMVMAGSLEINSSDKAARFIRFCDCFNIPLLSLVDVPAFMPGSAQEYGGIIRHGAKMLFAFAEAQVPKICLIMRKAYGGAYIAMNSKGLGADVVYAWPIAEIAVMGAAGAVAIIGRKAIDEAEDKAAKREELVDEYNRKFMNPYVAAERGYVDEVITPDETRGRIISALKMLENKRRSPIDKKHGNIPL